MPNHSKAVSTATPQRKEKRIANEVSVASPVKRVMSFLRAAEERREIRRKCTFGIYVLKTKDSFYGLPFVGINDAMALAANKEILPLANLYRIGDYCRLDAKITVYKTPKIILDK